MGSDTKIEVAIKEFSKSSSDHQKALRLWTIITAIAIVVQAIIITLSTLKII